MYENAYNVATSLRKCRQENRHITFTTADGMNATIVMPQEKPVDLEKGDPEIIRGRLYLTNSLVMKAGLLLEDKSGKITKRHEKGCLMVKDYSQLDELQDAHRHKLVVTLKVMPICKMVAGEEFTKAYSLCHIIKVDECEFALNN